MLFFSPRLLKHIKTQLNVKKTPEMCTILFETMFQVWSVNTQGPTLFNR